MVNKFKDINWSPNLAERRKFGLTLMAGAPCMGVGLTIILRLASGHWNFQVPAIVAGIGFTLGLVSWILPVLALPIYRAWYFLICIIDTVVTAVVLTVLFYVVIFPAGLLYRLFKGSAFRKRPDLSCASYWQDVPAVEQVSRYYRQY
jgi:hypothetical protein